MEITRLLSRGQWMAVTAQLANNFNSWFEVFSLSNKIKKYGISFFFNSVYHLMQKF